MVIHFTGPRLADTGWSPVVRFLLQVHTDHPSLQSWASNSTGLTSEDESVTQVMVLKESAKLCSQKAGLVWDMFSCHFDPLQL